MKKRIRNLMLAITMAFGITTTSVAPALAATTYASNSVEIFDFNNDGEITLSDAVILARVIAEVPGGEKNFKRSDPNNDGLVDLKDLAELLKYLNAQETDPDPDTTTETTTTTTETTTTTTQTTSTETTTTTTTTETSTTSTTTSETTTEVTLKKSIELLNSILDDITVTDTAIPACNCDLYEVPNQIYLFKSGNQTYAYTLLIDSNDGLTNGEIFISASYIKGLHIWLYTGNEVAVSESDSLPNTDGITFYCEDPSVPNKTEFEYSLRDYSRNTASNVAYVAALVADNRVQRASDIANYDYNINGVVDVADVEIMVRYFVSNPYNFFWSLNEEAFMRYIDYLPDLGHTNVILHTTSATIPQEYAFNIPTKDLEYSDNSAVVVPVQILPIEDADLLSDYEEETLDEDADEYSWIAWIPTMELWCKIPESSDYWSFRAGYYVYCLDDNGNYVTELIK